MITIELATALRDAGLTWEPTEGDRFVIPLDDLDDKVFLISEMTIEVHQHHGDRVIKFNGTTEWALDSIVADQVVWLPREEQLRAALGRQFVSLTTATEGFEVTIDAPGTGRWQVTDPDAECAYARALLATDFAQT